MAYKDNFTLDGLVKPVPGVSKRKTEAVSRLIEKTMQGNFQAAGTLREALTTSDAIFNFAHAVNLNFVPNFADLPRDWSDIAGVRGAGDFRPVALYTLNNTWGDGTLGSEDPRHVAPAVPEGSAYPLAYMAGEEIEGGKVLKRGFKTDFTFEALINDTVGFIRALPENMREIAINTEQYEVMSALLNAITNANKLAGGVIPDGDTVAAGAALGRATLVRAVIELAQRKHNGRYIPANGKYVLLVAPGQKVFADFVIHNQTLTGLVAGDDKEQTITVAGYNPLANIEAKESEYLSGTQWILTPREGRIGARPVLERLYLIGHEVPELRVSNVTGSYVGGGAVSPFEGSFENDSTTFRLRMFGGGVAWTPQAIIWGGAA